MNGAPRLVLEVLSGPLDGAVIALEVDTEWRRGETGPLAFPWDLELGEPQARFVANQGNWCLEAAGGTHGTYRLNHQERVDGRVILEEGDIIKASRSWLVVQRVG